MILVILEEDTFEKFGYSPSDLLPHSTKKVVCTCDSCGKIRILSKQKAHKLCRGCALIKIHASGTTRKSPSLALTKPKVKRICKSCHKEFYVIPSFLSQGKGIFCSMTCYRSWQQKNKVTCICQICGKNFWSSKTLLEKGWGKFCSRKCHGQWQSRDPEYAIFLRTIGKNIRSPTQPELIFKDICEKNKLPFTYVGDGTFFIGNGKKLNPDFVECNGKKIAVEIFGDYWHSPLLHRKLKESARLDYRQRFYKRFGWISVFLWETDLKRADAEKFVLMKLQREGAYER